MSKWCQKGALPYHCLPLSKDRRISRAALVEFIGEYGLDMPPQLAAPARLAAVGVLVVGPAAEAMSGPAAAVATSRGELAGCVIGCGEGLAAALELAWTLKKEWPPIALGLVLPADRDGAPLPAGLFAAVYRDGEAVDFSALARSA